MKILLISAFLAASIMPLAVNAATVQENHGMDDADPAASALQQDNMVPLLNGEMAQNIVKSANLEAQKDKLAVSITVVDRSGQTLAVLRDHRAGAHTLRASYKKAYTAS